MKVEMMDQMKDLKLVEMWVQMMVEMKDVLMVG